MSSEMKTRVCTLKEYLVPFTCVTVVNIPDERVPFYGTSFLMADEILRVSAQNIVYSIPNTFGYSNDI